MRHWIREDKWQMLWSEHKCFAVCQSCECVVHNASGGKSYEKKRNLGKVQTLIKFPIFVTENLLNVKDSEMWEVMNQQHSASVNDVCQCVNFPLYLEHILRNTSLIQQKNPSDLSCLAVWHVLWNWAVSRIFSAISIRTSSILKSYNMAYGV